MFRSTCLAMALAVFAAGFGDTMLTPKASAAAVQTEFVLKNHTNAWLSLFVDGSRTISVPPGDQGVVLVTPGNHTFKAVTLDKSARTASRTANVGTMGTTWTITER